MSYRFIYVFIYYLKPTCTPSGSKVTCGRGAWGVGRVGVNRDSAHFCSGAWNSSEAYSRSEKQSRSSNSSLTNFKGNKDACVENAVLKELTLPIMSLILAPLVGGGNVWRVRVKLASACSPALTSHLHALSNQEKGPLPWVSVSLHKGFQWSSSHPENPHTTAVIMIKLLSNAWLDSRARQPQASLSRRCQVQLGEGSRKGNRGEKWFNWLFFFRYKRLFHGWEKSAHMHGVWFQDGATLITQISYFEIHPSVSAQSESSNNSVSSGCSKHVAGTGEANLLDGAGEKSFCGMIENLSLQSLTV